MILWKKTQNKIYIDMTTIILMELLSRQIKVRQSLKTINENILTTIPVTGCIASH